VLQVLRSELAFGSVVMRRVIPDGLLLAPCVRLKSLTLLKGPIMALKNLKKNVLLPESNASMEVLQVSGEVLLFEVQRLGPLHLKVYGDWRWCKLQ
jgi:hypothetical protein